MPFWEAAYNFTLAKESGSLTESQVIEVLRLNPSNRQIAKDIAGYDARDVSGYFKNLFGLYDNHFHEQDGLSAKDNAQNALNFVNAVYEELKMLGVDQSPATAFFRNQMNYLAGQATAELSNVQIDPGMSHGNLLNIQKNTFAWQKETEKWNVLTDSTAKNTGQAVTGLSQVDMALYNLGTTASKLAQNPFFASFSQSPLNVGGVPAFSQGVGAGVMLTPEQEAARVAQQTQQFTPVSMREMDRGLASMKAATAQLSDLPSIDFLGGLKTPELIGKLMVPKKYSFTKEDVDEIWNKVPNNKKKDVLSELQHGVEDQGDDETNNPYQYRRTPNPDDYKSKYRSQSAAPKQVIVNIENLMNVESVDLSNPENKAVVTDLKEQLAQVLIDVVHDFDETWHGG